ncbi:hypothetical protein [Leucobacter tardus]|uniref:Uncharacterized protein n=1 Tax=Leucobacter tardus TaxID=501483 RepID=A0A939QG55_9MICO|nr:hypothetical protein [Leucobacter tardus]MBO2990618.1 hypothetical protein [Leucobacter tardus]
MTAMIVTGIGVIAMTAYARVKTIHAAPPHSSSARRPQSTAFDRSRAGARASRSEQAE